MTVRRLIIFSVKTLSKDPYLKSFISKVRTKHRESFSSFSRYATRLSVEAFFLTALHRAVGTKAVKQAGTVISGTVYKTCEGRNTPDMLGFSHSLREGPDTVVARG